MPDAPANVFVSSWLPQQDLLAHPKVGGLLLVSEITYPQVFQDQIVISRCECSSLMVVQEVPRRQSVTRLPSLAFPSTETRWTTKNLIQCCMCCPQHTNVAEAVRNEVGLLEDWHSLEADSLLASVQEVLNNPKYREAVTRLSDLIMDTPQHPLDRSTLIYSPLTFGIPGRFGGLNTCFDTRTTPG